MREKMKTSPNKDMITSYKKDLGAIDQERSVYLYNLKLVGKPNLVPSKNSEKDICLYT